MALVKTMPMAITLAVTLARRMAPASELPMASVPALAMAKT